MSKGFHWSHLFTLRLLFVVEMWRSAAVDSYGGSYANINDVDTGGGDVSASHKMAKDDSKSMAEYKTKIINVGRRYGIDPALIAGIISRESSGGRTLNEGRGDWDEKRKAYNAWGLMQVDVNPEGGNHKPIGEWDSEDHMNQATEILVGFIECIGKRTPPWTPEETLRGGIAAYNAGDEKVISYARVDEKTHLGNYSSDVVARAQWYKRNGY